MDVITVVQGCKGVFYFWSRSRSPEPCHHSSSDTWTIDFVTDMRDIRNVATAIGESSRGSGLIAHQQDNVYAIYLTLSYGVTWREKLIKCYSCGQQGHIGNVCPKKNAGNRYTKCKTFHKRPNYKSDEPMVLSRSNNLSNLKCFKDEIINDYIIKSYVDLGS